MTGNDYWQECLSNAAEECELSITSEQLKCLADAAENGHDNYGMAFYSPPSSDRIHAIERESDQRYKRLESEFEQYKRNAETAVKTALKQHPDSRISIGSYGEVTRYDGRTERIQ